MNFIVYSTVTGQIMRTGRTESLDMVSVKANQSLMKGVADAETKYVRNGKFVQRPVSTVASGRVELIANGLDKLKFNALNMGAKVAIVRSDGRHIHATVEGQEGIDITLDSIGEYVIEIDDFPRQDARVFVRAT